jgi:hypothetical protein
MLQNSTKQTQEKITKLRVIGQFETKLYAKIVIAERNF